MDQSREQQYDIIFGIQKIEKIYSVKGKLYETLIR